MIGNRCGVAASLAIVLGCSVRLSGQEGAHASELLRPSASSWPVYHGDYSGRRHSALTQITPQNVQARSRMGVSNRTNRISSLAPLVVDGMLYFTRPDNVWAVDARSGHLIWHYQYHRIRLSHRSPWRVNVRGLAFLSDPRRTLGFLQCEGRKRQMERGCGR